MRGDGVSRRKPWHWWCDGSRRREGAPLTLSRKDARYAPVRSSPLPTEREPGASSRVRKVMVNLGSRRNTSPFSYAIAWFVSPIDHMGKLRRPMIFADLDLFLNHGVDVVGDEFRTSELG